MRVRGKYVNKTVTVFFLVAQDKNHLRSSPGTLEELHADCLELRSGNDLLVIPFSAVAYVRIVRP